MHDDHLEAADSVAIAIVGMAGRFPGAADVDTFWCNIRDGVESVTAFTDAELRERDVPAQLLDDPDYVKAGIEFDDADQFDAEFFGYTPRDAEHLDPQQRIFLECAWAALEHAGYDPGRCGGRVGVYAGSGANLYLIRHILPRYGLDNGGNIADLLGLMSGNLADALCTRVAYKLNLRGPAVTVQTACSTSLMAVHSACQSLLGYECDMALAGGVSLNLLQNGGYRYQPGAIFSPDGHCRAFDADAAGTLLGSGAGIVVLKRLDDAERDGDTIHAVIKGSAANNDGTDKVGFTAPGVTGQAEVIRAAQLVADIDPETIGYIEAHGTATILGDPIEIAALTQAFRATTQRSQYCAIGSVKTNVGHLDAAAGVAGLIKTVMALKHRILPASLHFTRPNPQIDFANSPFYVNTQTQPWETHKHPRRAGVSSFGIGGTNVHLVVEEASGPELEKSDDGFQVLPLSARDQQALYQACTRLTGHLHKQPQQRLADVSYTLQWGRRAFRHRAAVVASESPQAAALLASPEHIATTALADETTPEVVFLFPGGGSQHLNMGAALYRNGGVFREEIDRCRDILQAEIPRDLQRYIIAGEDDEMLATELSRMAMAQPALFAVNYAMAKQWTSLGVQPALMLGHSLGEYVAACLAGVFSLEDALRIVAARGRLMESLDAGAMTAVAMAEQELLPLLGGCDLAAINGERLCVIAGPLDRVEAVEKTLNAQQQMPRRLHVAVASHSAMMEPIMSDLEALIAAVPRHAPHTPFISNVTGTIITAEQATDPAYWSQHMRRTVRFADGLNEVFSGGGRAVLEVGPGDALTSLARQHPLSHAAVGIWPSQAHAQQPQQSPQQFAKAQAGLWTVGVDIDWRACHATRKRRRVPLPNYPFQRQRYWLDATSSTAAPARSSPDNLYTPSWRRVPWASSVDNAEGGCVLVLGDDSEPTRQLLAALRQQCDVVILVAPGDQYTQVDDCHYRVRASERGDHDTFIRQINSQWGVISRIYYLWAMDIPTGDTNCVLERSFFAPMALIQALGNDAQVGSPVTFIAIVDQLEDVSGIEPICPAKATLHGLCKVISQEYPAIDCRLVDIALRQSSWATRAVWEHAAPVDETVVAYRGEHRWVKQYEPLQLNREAEPRLRRQGVYLITGGLGGVGLSIARHLAEHWQARLILLGRSALPERDLWGQLAVATEQPEKRRKILRQLLELESLGAEVLTCAADVADADQLGHALHSARQRFGDINGIIHAAGDAGGGMLADRKREQVLAVFAPKIQGTDVIKQLVANDPLDFVLLCSSIASIAGGLGKSDYAAANAYLDAAATRWRRDVDYPVFAVGWDAWRDLGMAEGMVIPEGIGMDGPQGAQMFERIVNGASVTQMTVCTTDLSRRLGTIDSDALAVLENEDKPAFVTARARPALQSAFVAPSGDIEEALAVIWGDRLGISPVGVDDNLFELGGDSLVAIQLLAQVRKQFALDMHPSEFFRTPTIAGLHSRIEDKLDALPEGIGITDNRFQIEVIPRAPEMMVSPVQQRLWLVDRLSQDRDDAALTAYNMAAVIELIGDVSPDAVERAINAIVARHEVLRTIYAENTEGDPVAVINKELALDIPLIDWSERENDQFRDYVDDYFQQLTKQPFDLAAGPLLRAVIIKAKDRCSLILVVHHIVFDGWSIAVFAREFAQFYQAFQAGVSTEPAPLRVQYADYARWHEQFLDSSASAESRTFWRRYLQNAPQQSTVKPDFPRPGSLSYQGNCIRIEIAEALKAELSQLAHQSELSLFTVLVATFLWLLHRESGADDLVIGTDVAGRIHPDVEDLIGFFVNVVPLRSKRSSSIDPFSNWLRKTADSVLPALDHQAVPFDQIIDIAGAERAANRNPLLQVLFVLQNTPEIRFDIPGVSVNVVPQAMDETKFDLAVFIKDRGDQLEVDWVYSTLLYQPQTIERMASVWQAILTHVAENPDVMIDEAIPPVKKPSVQNKLDKLNALAGGNKKPQQKPRTLVRVSSLAEGHTLPAVITPEVADVDGVSWVNANRPYVDDLLTQHGGILFRDFGMTTPQEFEMFAEAVQPGLFGGYGDLPKKEGGKNIYRSTPYPENEMILYHNESSHLDRWPRRQLFFCETPPGQGGATPIVDCREVLCGLPVAVVRRFEDKGLLYVRTFTPRLDVSWQDFYKTDDPAEVEAQLSAAGIAWRWLDRNTLQTRSHSPAMINHPITGERVFFNQIQLHHPYCLDARVRADLQEMVGADRMPRQVYYGDGSPIEDETVALIVQCYEQRAVRFSWRQGDVVLLDNMLVAHARDPFKGERKIVVAMGAMFDRAALNTAPDQSSTQQEVTN